MCIRDRQNLKISDIVTLGNGTLTGTVEPGSTVTLDLGDGVARATVLSADGASWSYQLTPNEATAFKTADATTVNASASDAAGNTASTSQTFLKADLLAPTVQEFIPANGSSNIANGPDGKAELNLVFSEDVVKGSGAIKLYDFATNALVETIDVSGPGVTVNGTDVFIKTGNALTTGTHYYVTLDAGSFKDSDGTDFAGLTETGLNGWDFTASAMAIKPAFVAGDDVVNAAEAGAPITVNATLVAAADVRAAIAAGDITVTVTDGTGNPVAGIGAPTYDGATGQIGFAIPAGTLSADGTYSYKIEVTGSNGPANGLHADYPFTALVVDKTAPTATANISAVQDDAGSVTAAVVAGGVSDDTSPLVQGVLSEPLKSGERIVVLRSDNGGPAVEVSGPAGIRSGTTDWSFADSGLQDGHTYTYSAVVQDAAGNTSAPGASYAITIDTTAPVVQSVAFAGATGAVNNTLNAGDKVQVKVSLSEAAVVVGVPQVALLLDLSLIHI